MKIRVQYVKSALVLSNYLTAASLGYLMGANTKELVFKRELDADISPHQDPHLASVYGYANEADASKRLRLDLDYDIEQSASTKHVIRDNVELINDAPSAGSLQDDYPVEVLGDEDNNKEDVVYQFSLPDSSDDGLDQVSVEENSIHSSLKKLFSSDIFNLDKSGDSDDDYDDEIDVNQVKRAETKESENGKTIPDYFDPVMGDRDPEPPCSDDEIEDEYGEYKSTGEEDEGYENKKSISKSDLEIRSDDNIAAATLDQNVPAQILSSDPAEIIPFPKVRMFPGVAEIPVNDSVIPQNSKEGCESKGMPLQSSSVVAIVCCTIVILLMGF